VQVNRAARIAIAAGLLGGVGLAGPSAHAQALRADDDPFARVGVTAGEAGRRGPPVRARRLEVPPPAPLRARTPKRLPLRGADALAAAAEPEAVEGPPVEQARPRPKLQNFRSLERPPNLAAVEPTPGGLVSQGLPPPPPPRRAPASVVDPYAPLGLRMGTLQVFPSAEVGIGYDTNPERRAGAKKGSGFARGEAALSLRSDWAVHELTADVRGGYNRYFTMPDADRPDGTGRIGLRLDAARDTAFDVELRGRVDTQAPGSANLTGRAQGRPLITQYGGSAGVTQRFNRLALSARASVDRTDYADAKLADGQPLSQKDRNLTQYGLRLRTGYELSPGLVPFAEVLLDTRKYDVKADSTGFRRDSDGVQLRAGTSIELTRTLTGEVSAGYGLRRYEDQRLGDLRAPVVEAVLTWALSPLTTVKLRGATEFEETTIAGSSGAVTRRLSAELSHAFLRNLTATATASYGRSDFQGVTRQDDTIRAGLGLDYAFTRNIVLRGSFNHERTTSNVAGNNLSGNIWLFGVRGQF
jgi:hypothetical protein